MLELFKVSRMVDLVYDFMSYALHPERKLQIIIVLLSFSREITHVFYNAISE